MTKISLLLLGIFIVVLLVAGGFAFEEVVSGPEVTVTVSPDPPLSFRDTLITIEADDPFGITMMSILDETRSGKFINISWGKETHGPLEVTYRLSDLFKREQSLEDLNELQIQITIRNAIGKETMIEKRINFKRVE